MEQLTYSYCHVREKSLFVQELKVTGVRAFAIRRDEADLTVPEALIGAVVSHFGKLDILVNNAAIAVEGKAVDDPALDTVNLDRQWQINVMGAVATTRAAAPVLSNGGRIIFIGSGLGSHVPFAGDPSDLAQLEALLGAVFANLDVPKKVISPPPKRKLKSLDGLGLPLFQSALTEPIHYASVHKQILILICALPRFAANGAENVILCGAYAGPTEERYKCPRRTKRPWRKPTRPSQKAISKAS